MKPDVVAPTINSAMPASVSTTTGGSVIAASQQRSAAHNALVLQQSGRKIGGSKRSDHKKRSNHKKQSKRSKRSDHKKRSKRSNRSKRSDHKKRSKRSNHKKRSKRSKRGGENPTPTPSSKPSVAPVPQFSGAHNAAVNNNSIAGNHLLMKAGSQSVFDNTHATPSTTVLNA